MYKLSFYVTIIIIFGMLAFTCRKPCHEPDYFFTVNSEIYPEKDSVNVGDTIWLSCVIPYIEKDTNTKTLIDFSNAVNLGGNLIIADITKFHALERGAVDSFNYVKIIGNIDSDSSLNPSNVKQLGFEKSNEAFALKVGLIAQKKGLYILTVPDIPDVYRKGSPHCGKGKFQIVNANTNKHLYLFENLWGQLSTYDSAHSYCFKVK